jgi:lipooligosaccharide transport system permease protein
VSLTALATTPGLDPALRGRGRRGMAGHERTLRVVERNLRAYRRGWIALATGFVEPVLFLLSIGIGVGELVGTLPGPGGRPIAYDQFVAPGMLASAAMNGAILDTTYNFFVKFKYAKTYDAMLATPLDVDDVARGEAAWSLGRGAIYAVGFLVTMALFGLTPSWWSILAVPVAILIGYAFAGVGLAATTYMRSFIDFDFVTLAVTPLFVFSGTFFPVERYPAALEVVVRCSPLYQGVVLSRAVVLGDLYLGLLVPVAYLAIMGWAGTRIAAARLGKLLKP